MIDTAPLLKLFDKQYPLLYRRQGVARQFKVGDHRTGLLPHLGGQTGNGFQFKYLYQWDFYCQGIANGRRQLNGHQGVAADPEEVILNADPLQPQDILPDRTQPGFQRITRRHIIVPVHPHRRR